MRRGMRPGGVAGGSGMRGRWALGAAGVAPRGRAALPGPGTVARGARLRARGPALVGAAPGDSAGPASRAPAASARAAGRDAPSTARSRLPDPAEGVRHLDGVAEAEEDGPVVGVLGRLAQELRADVRPELPSHDDRDEAAAESREVAQSPGGVGRQAKVAQQPERLEVQAIRGDLAERRTIDSVAGKSRAARISRRGRRASSRKKAARSPAGRSAR